MGLDPEEDDDGPEIDELLYSNDGLHVAVQYRDADELIIRRTVDLVEVGRSKGVEGTALCLYVCMHTGISVIATDDGSLHVTSLDRTCGVPPHKLRSIDIASIAVSPNGHRIAVGCIDGTLRVYDIYSGKQIVARGAHDDEIAAVEYAHSSSLIVTGSYDGLVGVWDGESLYTVSCLHGHEDEVTCVAVSHDDEYVVSGSRDKTIRVWSMRDVCECHQELLGHEMPVVSLDTSNDGRLLASGGDDDFIWLWDTRSGRAVDVFRRRGVATLRGREIGAMGGTRQYSNAVEWSADDSRVAAKGIYSNTLKVFDAKNGSLVARYPWGDLQCAALSPDGARVAIGCSNGRIEIASAQGLLGTGTSISLGYHCRSVLCIGFSKDGRYVVAGSHDDGSQEDAVKERGITIWDTSIPKRVCSYRGHIGRVSAVEFNDDATRVVSAGGDMTIHVWSIANGRAIAVLRGHNRFVHSVAFACMDCVMSVSADGTTRLWHIGLRRLVSVPTVVVDGIPVGERQPKADNMCGVVTRGEAWAVNPRDHSGTLWLDLPTGNLLAASPEIVNKVYVKGGGYCGYAGRHVLIARLQGPWRVLMQCAGEANWEDVLRKHGQPLVGPNEKNEYWPADQAPDDFEPLEP